MKKSAVTLLLSMGLGLSAWAQNTDQDPFQQSVLAFVNGPNTCNLFLGVDDSGFDGMTMDYAEKLAAILSSAPRTPQQAYAAIYQQCQIERQMAQRSDKITLSSEPATKH